VVSPLFFNPRQCYETNHEERFIHKVEGPALPSLGSIVVARITGLRASLEPQEEASIYHEEQSSMHCEDFAFEAPVRVKPSSSEHCLS
jgi:hypothetical protein